MQLSIFDSKTTNQKIPDPIQHVLTMGATLAVSISGGKDSDAMLRHLVRIHQAQKWPGKLFAITADLGRIEWPGTLEHIKALCHELGVPLTVVRRAKGGDDRPLGPTAADPRRQPTEQTLLEFRFSSILHQRTQNR